MKDKNKHRLLSDSYANHIHVLRAMCLEKSVCSEKPVYSEKSVCSDKTGVLERTGGSEKPVVSERASSPAQALARDIVSSTRSLEISEIAERSGLEDEKEVLRSLYILEGAKFVSPNPVGDFTSKIWRITDDGVRAFQTITAELALLN